MGAGLTRGFLSSLVKHRATIGDERRFAKEIVDDYVLYYFDYALAGLSVDLSACKIDEETMQKLLANAIGELGLSLKAKLEDRAGRTMSYQPVKKPNPTSSTNMSISWTFAISWRDDLRLIQLTYRLKKLCCEAENAVETIVKNSSYVGPDYQESNGLSVYFPWNSVPEEFSEGYEQLEFTRRTTRADWRQVHYRSSRKTIRATAGVHWSETSVYPGGERLCFQLKPCIQREPSMALGQYCGSRSTAPRDPRIRRVFVMAYCKPPSLVWKPRKNIATKSRHNR